MIGKNFNTIRTICSPAGISDLPELIKIEEECDRYFAFDPQCELNHDCSLEDCIIKGDIPAGINQNDFKKENYFLYCIKLGGKIIGFFSYYLEYQQKDSAYLSVLYIGEQYRRHGFGSEILNALTDKLITARFKTIRLHCSLRNSTALRFWVKNGFDRILNVETDGNLYLKNFGGLELMKKIH